MTALRRVMRILGAAGLLAAPVSAAARERPAWLTRVPENSATHAYFVGQDSEAPTLDAGRESAFKDAAAQVAAFIGSRVSGRVLSRRTTLESRISSEIRSSSHSRLRGARVTDRFEEELPREKRGARSHHRVAVLLEYPLAEVRRERERLEQADRELAERQDALCQGLAEKLSSARPGAVVRVASFKEASSQQRRPFSRILEDGLRSCLSAKGLNVTGSSQADLVVSGDFWQAGQVEVSAKAADKAGRIVAARAVRLSLDAVDPLWMTDDDDEANNFFSKPDEAAPRRAHGSVSVRSEPPGAEIYVDGVSRGPTPADILGIEPGPRTIQLRLDGYVPDAKEVLVEEGSRPMVRITLRRQTGTLSLHSLPEGARIRLDGKITGTTPSRLGEIPTGRHEVSLELRDHKPWSQSVEIEYEKTTSLDPELTKEDGALSMVVEPAGVRLLLDGVHVGDSLVGRALRLSPVAAGPHSVRAEKEGREPREWKVLVNPRATASVTGALPVAAAVPEPFHAPRLSLPKPPSLDRPDGMRYLNIFGAAFNGEYRNLRFLEVTAYGFSSTLGLGTSLVETTRVRDWKTTRTPVAVSWYQTSSPNPPARVGFDMVSIFPIKLYLTPIAHAYHLGENEFVASLQLYSSFCFWALPSIDGLSESSDNKGIPTGSVMDFGALIHLGPAVGMRVGMVEAQFPKFTFANDSYSAFHDRKFYLAADVSLGAFFPKR
ncbi:MAG: hypothetical protein A2V88_04835 [Elusimicrobia bacterium RBG_16_66_12]|nr:MAG: hypothetical protein A2V88_04835 [Elusimicrobia bacterium RBG_16_66_12]